MAGETILVVEDETLVGVELQEWLTDLGYRVPEVVDDGGLVSPAISRVRPDLILMDIRIKGSMDGVQAAGEIRRDSDIPIIFLTAYSDPNTVARASEVGSDGMLLKPFRERELEVNVALALKKSSARKKLNQGIRRWVPVVDTMETAMALFDPSGRLVHANPVARAALGPEVSETTLADLLRVTQTEFEANPGGWALKELGLPGLGSNWVLSFEEIATQGAREGFLARLNPMERMEREHLATSLQTIRTNLTGQVPPTDAYGDRLSNAGFLVPRPSGTGDFYDLFPLGPHHFLFYSLDVSGHGVLSSMTVAALRWMIRELAGNALVRTHEIPSPSSIVETLNRRYLESTLDGPMFTLALGILTPSSGDLQLVRAGHPAPLLLGPDQSCQPLGAVGSALGVFPDIQLEEVEVRLRGQQRLLLASDGVLERLGDRSVEQGQRALAALMRPEQTLVELVQAVQDACMRVPGPQTDDLSLLVLEPKLW